MGLSQWWSTQVRPASCSSAIEHGIRTSATLLLSRTWVRCIIITRSVKSQSWPKVKSLNWSLRGILLSYSVTKKKYWNNWLRDEKEKMYISYRYSNEMFANIERRSASENPVTLLNVPLRIVLSGSEIRRKVPWHAQKQRWAAPHPTPLPEVTKGGWRIAWDLEWEENTFEFIWVPKCATDYISVKTKTVETEVGLKRKKNWCQTSDDKKNTRLSIECLRTLILIVFIAN